MVHRKTGRRMDLKTDQPSNLLVRVRTGDFGLGRDHPFFFRAERGGGSGFCDHAQGGAEGHEDEDPFEKIL